MQNGISGRLFLIGLESGCVFGNPIAPLVTNANFLPIEETGEEESSWVGEGPRHCVAARRHVVSTGKENALTGFSLYKCGKG